MQILLSIKITGKNNRFPFFFFFFNNLKNTHKNPKFGRMRQVTIRELGWESLVGTCLTLPNLEFLRVCFKYPKVSKNGNPLFFPVNNVSSYYLWVEIGETSWLFWRQQKNKKYSSFVGTQLWKCLTIDLVTVFGAILTSRQTCEKLQYLFENLMSNNFRKMDALKKIFIVD